ncbi:InlB B-repeat-containing protein, partial [Leucobacter soli]|uniref:InlB B-repeat-containing protein n=1 Tax=Leucobacter soli TaxID=2812850 RepID=UPI00360CD30E
FAALGSYDAVVTATDGGAVSQPVAVSIAVVPLSGAGTAASPFRIDSAEDVDAAVALVNADAAGTGAAKAHYRLTEDIDYSGGSFTPFAKFSGIFDGGGRTVRDLAITAAGNPGAGFFVELVGGTVTGLTLADLAVTNSVGTSRAGAIAATASGATVRGNTVLGSTVTLDFATGSNNGQAGGIVGSAGTGTVISDNLVINSSIRGAKYAAGIVAYPLNNQGNAIRGNLLVDTTVAARAAGSGSSVGMLLSQGGAGTEVSGNVVIRGGIGSDNADVEHVNVAPRDVTATTVNYASAATALTQKGDRTATSAQVAELPAQPDSGTFAGIGWDLGDDHGDGRWAWDASRGYPVLVAAVLPSVAVEIDLAGGANGGIGEGGAGDARHGYGATTKLVNPTREHYGFAGWTGTGITGTASDVTLPRYATDDLAYTATWAPTEFTIGYDLAGGSSDESGLLVYTVETGAFELVAPSREGYRFAGWTGTGLYGATAEVTVPAGASGNRAYTATWEPIAYDLEIDLAGGEPGDPNQSSYTVETDSFLLVNPTRIGYWFAGWTGTGADEPTMRVTIARGSTGDRAYTATWTPISYHVIYGIADDEEFSDDPVGSYTIESDAFTLPVPVRAGYTFAGWTGTGLDGPTRTVTVPVGSVGERSYVPTWSVTEYSIGYRLAGGKAAEGNPTSYTVESSSFTLRKPTRTNYSFAGWSGLGAKRTSLTVPTGTTGDLTFTATWKKKAKTKAKVAVSYVKKTKKQKNYSRVNVAVSRVAGYSTPTGTVKVTVTGKVKQKVRGKASTVTVTRTAKAKLSSGSVRVSIPKGLKPGTYKLKVAYHGNSMYQKSNSKTVALKIKRK